VTLELKDYRRTIDRSLTEALTSVQYVSGRNDLIRKVAEVARDPRLANCGSQPEI